MPGRAPDRVFAAARIFGPILLGLGIGCAPHGSPSVKLEHRPEFAEPFARYGVGGAILIYDQRADRWLCSDSTQVDRAFIPASTFKIFNSLVALETGVIADENDTIRWDGVDRGWPEWNRDHTLQSAIRVSAVWFYQELARRIGPGRMQHHVDLAGYGNGDIGGGIDRFWLEGELRITARQQIELLRRLHDGVLPFSPQIQEVVRDILTVEQTENYTLRAKTGWGQRFAPQVGWYVGYIEQEDGVLYFATRVDIAKDDDARAREAVTRGVLAELGYL